MRPSHSRMDAGARVSGEVRQPWKKRGIPTGRGLSVPVEPTACRVRVASSVDGSAERAAIRARPANAGRAAGTGGSV